MKLPLLTGLAMTCAATALAAQTGTTPTTQSPTSAGANQTVTLSGCVGGTGTTTDPFILSNVNVVNSAAAGRTGTAGVGTAGAGTAGVGTVGAGTGTAAGAGVGTAGTAGAGTGTGTMTGSAGSGTGTASAAGTAGAGTGTAGATGTAGTGTAGAGAAGTTGSVTGTAGTPPVGAGATGTMATGSPQTGMPTPSSATAGTNAGYRLSGADMSPFAGQRVQIVGTFAPAATGSSTVGAAGAAGSTTSSVPEFRIISVQPMTGNCRQ